MLFVVAGALIIEHRDGSRATWHVADHGAPVHRVICASGATVFIVD